MKGGNANIRSINLSRNLIEGNQKLKITNTDLGSQKNTIKLNTPENSLEFKKKELIRMYGKYLNNDLLNKDFYDETAIHILYNDLVSNNKEIKININKNEIITFN